MPNQNNFPFRSKKIRENKGDFLEIKFFDDIKESNLKICTI
jgi:hypothetical protein